MSNDFPLAATLPVGFGSLMAQALRGLGKPGFYESVVELVRQMIPCDFWIIARYEARSKPLIISENGMNLNAKTLYSDRLWQQDPLPQHADGHETRAVSLRELRRVGALDSAYDRYLNRTLGIEDELAMLFPISPGSFLALCLDRQQRAFTDDELNLARELQTVLVEMHHQHMLRAIDRRVSLFLHDSGVGKPEVMILSNNDTVLYKSDTWSRAAIRAFDREPLPSEISSGQVAATGGRDGWSLTRMSDDSSDAILAGADVFVLRRNPINVADRVTEFSRVHRLTERQEQILILALQGHPNASIAEKLRITVGSVKNHKLRLYEKLDITSERELTSAVLSHL